MSRIQQIEAVIGNELRKALGSTGPHIPRKPREPRVCSIFSLGNANYKNLHFFADCINFITERYRINQIYIEAEVAHSGFMFILKKPKPFNHKIPITAVVWDAGSGQDDAEEPCDLKTEFCPPCDRVESIGGVSAADRRISTILEMMDRSTFCICDLSASAYSRQISAHIPQTKQAVLLDMGKGIANTDLLWPGALG